MDINDKHAETIQDLLEKNYDAERGYADAAETTKHADLARWFGRQGKQRTRFAAELSKELKNLGHKPKTDGTVKGDAHRGWMNLKAALSNTDEKLLEECIRGEKASLKEYDGALKNEKKLAPSLVSTMRNHKMDIQATLDKVKSLEDVADLKNK